MWEERNMPGFLTDVTPNVSKHRGNEIDAWLSDCREVTNYVIIDDLPKENFNHHQSAHLVAVDPYTGLNTTDAELAISILQYQCQ